MSDPNAALLDAFDGHVVERVRAALAAGADLREPIEGKLATDWLLEHYHRSDRLPECLRLLVDHGATFRDPAIAAVVLNDPPAIRAAIEADPDLLTHRTSLRCSFASLEKATLLHVAAEYGHLAAVRTLIELGADVNATASVDEYDLNGHTPLFHTVNSHANRLAPIMRLLVDAGADCEFFVKGLDWGKGFPWETTFFDITPISFAQLGLLPQVHRQEADIYENIRFLLESANRPVPPLENVPNRYLKK
ncbi:MAG: ankyrin repeat domain-containing protein [Bythopirellula sp.]|nr:ankyrin repeat domain-containing protein [Bythopirellula sp.]